jgi:hypothetical protein
MKKFFKCSTAIFALMLITSLLISNPIEPPKCDQSTGAFCKNTPGMNTGVCETKEKGVCCVFTTQGNKDCYDASH